MRTARRTSPLPLLFTLALLIFSAGLLAGWTGASVAAQGEPAPRIPNPAPAQSALALPSPTPIPTSEPPAPAEDWALVLVNFDHPLPEGFAVPEFTQLRNGHSIDSRA